MRKVLSYIEIRGIGVGNETIRRHLTTGESVPNVTIDAKVITVRRQPTNDTRPSRVAAVYPLASFSVELEYKDA